MRKIIVAVLALGLTGCISTGKPKVSCPAGISFPFVFIGVNACPGR